MVNVRAQLFSSKIWHPVVLGVVMTMHHIYTFVHVTRARAATGEWCREWLAVGLSACSFTSPQPTHARSHLFGIHARRASPPNPHFPPTRSACSSFGATIYGCSFLFHLRFCTLARNLGHSSWQLQLQRCTRARVCDEEHPRLRLTRVRAKRVQFVCQITMRNNSVSRARVYICV